MQIEQEHVEIYKPSDDSESLPFPKKKFNSSSFFLVFYFHKIFERELTYTINLLKKKKEDFSFLHKQSSWCKFKQYIKKTKNKQAGIS